MPFRKAKTIELHDANTAITLSEEGYGSSKLAARHDQPSRAAFQLRLVDIDALAERFGLRPREQARRLGDQQGQAALPFLKSYSETPMDQPGLVITNLECDVLEANLVDIRIETRRPSDAPETGGAVETITYSGAFTIWWAAEGMASAEELFAVAEAHPQIPVDGEIPTVTVIGEPDVGVIIPKFEDQDLQAGRPAEP
jgi:hypothetical protein